MVARRKPEEDVAPLPPPAKTLEGREDQLIAAAFDLAEKRIAMGTASAQEVVHFLRQGTVQAQLQNSKLRSENEVLLSRVKEMETRGSSDASAAEALAAFRGYAGIDAVDPEAYYDDEDR